MCGIIGFLDKRGFGPIGQTLLAMTQAVAPRGPDSTGLAVYGAPHEGLILRVKLGEESADELLAAQLGAALERFAPVLEERIEGAYWRVVVPADADLERLETLVGEAGGELVSAGRQLEIIKQVGSPAALEATYHVSVMTGTHGIGHTRMSTESRIDLSHSQPFWAKGWPDLAIAHNGHITNYHKLRRFYEEKGVRFYTENDSEIIGVYLCDRLERGDTLEEALESSLRDFDGSFCYLAATADTLAFVKDPYGFKPLVVAETDDFVAIVTEEIALRDALPGTFKAKEPAARSWRAWNIEGAKMASTDALAKA